MNSRIRKSKKTNSGIIIPEYVNSPVDALLLAVRMVHYKCSYCESPSEHADHIVPKDIEIFDIPQNLVGACGFCNRSKGKRLLSHESLRKALTSAWVSEKAVINLSHLIYARGHKSTDGIDRFFRSAEARVSDFQKIVRGLLPAA